MAACTSGVFLNGSSGIFSSPNFPNNYPQYSRCIWNISVPNGYIIKLTFHQFVLDYYARVTITNVASDDGRRPFRLYGSSLPSPVYSVGNFSQVIFTSSAYQRTGFNASYTAITYAPSEFVYGRWTFYVLCLAVKVLCCSCHITQFYNWK